MRFTFLDYAFTTAAVLFIGWCCIECVGLLGFAAHRLPVEYRGIFNLSAFIFLYLFILGVVYPGILRIISPFKDGVEFSSHDKTLNSFTWKQTVFSYDWTGVIFSFVMPVVLRSLFYRLLGAKIGSNTLIAGKIIEPQMVEIGHNSIMGDTSLVSGHLVSQNRVVLKRVKIGNYATVGAHAIVMPGVNIGDHSIVAVGSLVLMNTIIKPREVWAGVPAVKIRSLEEWKKNQERGVILSQEEITRNHGQPAKSR